jgi:hypothetical protein
MAVVREEVGCTVSGPAGQNYFYAMEFVEGETLENLIKRSGRLEVRLSLVCRLCISLSAKLGGDTLPSKPPATRILPLGIRLPCISRRWFTGTSRPAK